MHNFQSALAALACLASACNSGEPPPMLTADTAALTTSIAWSTPQDGDNVSGAVALEVDLNGFAAFVAFSLDGVAIAKDSEGPPWSATWDSTTASNDTHVLKATAFRKRRGKIRPVAWDSITVIVAN